MSFETAIRAFAAALGEPSAPPPAMTHGRLGAPDARRFAIYRNNVAVGLIGALEARFPVSRRLAGDDLFRAIARAFVHAHKPRSPVMIAYGEEFPEFVAEYLATAGGPSLGDDALDRDRHREERSDAAIQTAGVRPTTPGLLRFARNDDGGPTELHCPAANLPDVARLENAWVESYHSADATAATMGQLAALNPDCLPATRVIFHPAAQLLRFATPAASIWASYQSGAEHAASEPAVAEDALITRPDCDVCVRVLPPLGFDFALSLREGATLIEAVAAVNDPGFDFGAHLVGLVECGAIASIIPGRAS
jgi:Putative DNA-binding domain